MSQVSTRPQRKAPRPSRFVEPGDSSDSRTNTGPGRTRLPGFSGVNTREDVATSAKATTDSISRTSTSTSTAAEGQDMSSGDGAGSVGRRDSSSNNSANSCEVVKTKFGAPGTWSGYHVLVLVHANTRVRCRRCCTRYCCIPGTRDTQSAAQLVDLLLNT